MRVVKRLLHMAPLRTVGIIQKLKVLQTCALTKIYTQDQCNHRVRRYIKIQFSPWQHINLTLVSYPQRFGSQMAEFCRSI